MTKIFIIIASCLFSLNSFAQGSFPSKEDVENKCKIFKNLLNEFELHIDDVENSEIELLKHKNIEYNYSDLSSDNKNFIDSLSAVLTVIPSYYAKDTTDNLALVILDKSIKDYQSYVDAVYKNNKILIREDFWDVLKSSISSFHQQYTRLTPSKNIVEEINIESQNNDASEQDSSETETSDIPIYIALVLSVLAVIISVITYISLKQLSQRLDRHRTDIDNLQTDVISIKDSQKHDGNIRHGANINYPSKPTLSNSQIDKLKEEILSYCLVKISSTYNGNTLPDSLSNASANITTSTISTPSINQPKKEKIEAKKQEHIMYAELRIDGTFKVTESDNGNAFFIIKLNDPNAKTGTFELKALSQDSMSAAIENRQLILMPACELTSIGQNKLNTDQPGIAEKVGNEWKVMTKAKVTIC